MGRKLGHLSFSAWATPIRLVRCHSWQLASRGFSHGVGTHTYLRFCNRMATSNIDTLKNAIAHSLYPFRKSLSNAMGTPSFPRKSREEGFCFAPCCPDRWVEDLESYSFLGCGGFRHPSLLLTIM